MWKQEMLLKTPSFVTIIVNVVETHKDARSDGKHRKK